VSIADPRTTEPDRREDAERAILATAKGGGYIAGGSFFELAARFAIALLLARHLGAEEYGLYVLAISAVSLFAGVSLLGLDDAMVRYVAIMADRRDAAGLWGTLQIGFVVSTSVAAAVGVVMFVAARPISEGIFHEPALTPLLHLFAIVVPFLAISNVLLGVARGFGRMDYATVGEKVVQSIVRLALIALLALVGRLHLYGAAVAFGIADVAASVTLIVLLHRVVSLRRPWRRDTRRDTRAVFSFALPLWMSGLLRQFRRNLETVLLGALATVSDVGVYSIVGRITLVSGVFSSALYVSVKPILARLHDRDDVVALSAVYTAGTRWMLAVSLPAVLVMVLYPDELLAIFGSSFGVGATALVVLALAQLADAATGICQPILDMTGHTRLKLANTLTWTVVLGVGGALMIPRWGVTGAAVASLIAVTVVNVAAIVEVYVLERLHPFDRKLFKPIAAAVLAMLAGIALRRLLPPEASLVKTALEASVVAAVYVVALVGLGLESEDRVVLERAVRRLAPRRWRRASVPERVGGGAA
jgi:O-antigen/teichoic acid export membrane protein